MRDGGSADRCRQRGRRRMVVRPNRTTPHRYHPSHGSNALPLSAGLNNLAVRVNATDEVPCVTSHDTQTRPEGIAPCVLSSKLSLFDSEIEQNPSNILSDGSDRTRDTDASATASVALRREDMASHRTRSPKDLKSLSSCLWSLEFQKRRSAGCVSPICNTHQTYVRYKYEIALVNACDRFSVRGSYLLVQK